MSITKDSSGYYESQIWYRDFDGTRRKKHKRGFRTKTEAKRWEKAFLLKSEGSPSMLFKDFATVYETDIKPSLKLNTFLTKRHILQTKLIPFFGEMKLDEITPADVMRWQGALRSATRSTTKMPYSATYVRTIENQLSAIFNHACRFYGLQANPLRQAGRVGKSHSGEMKFWTQDEYLLFSNSIMDKPQSYLAFEILYWTGCREGELLALTPEDFDFERRLLSISRSFQRLQGNDVITPPKTPKSNRVITIPVFLADEVREYIEMFGIGKDERIFNISKSYLYHEMGRGCRASGVKRIRVHDLRHSHVSLLIDLGFSALAIADRMGHEAVDITFRYAHLFPNVQGDMAKALETTRGGRTL